MLQGLALSLWFLKPSLAPASASAAVYFGSIGQDQYETGTLSRTFSPKNRYTGIPNACPVMSRSAQVNGSGCEKGSSETGSCP